MSQSQFWDWLLKIGMGWLGWTEADTLDTSMPAIMLAYEGRVDMLRKIFGSAESEPEPEMDAATAGRLLFARIRAAGQ